MVSTSELTHQESVLSNSDLQEFDGAMNEAMQERQETEEYCPKESHGLANNINCIPAS